jgi:hypothetical protein
MWMLDMVRPHSLRLQWPNSSTLQREVPHHQTWGGSGRLFAVAVSSAPDVAPEAYPF